jgi:uncharacterized coiled-coil protein SlyX
MTSPDRHKLIARVRQVSRLVAARDQPPATQDVPPTERVRALEVRVAHLEQMVEGLQDSVYRETERHEKLISEIQAQVQPGAMGAALADDERQRGL